MSGTMGGGGGPQQIVERGGGEVLPGEVYLDREYVYGPDYVDEFIVQFDRAGHAIFMLQDGNYNVVALVSGPGHPDGTGGSGGGGGSGGTGVLPTGTVLEQYTYEPYGALVAAEMFHAHAMNRAGHQGLFFERFDGTFDDYTLFRVLQGTAFITGAKGLYYNRNRFYSPTLGRFTTRDPKGQSLPLTTAEDLSALRVSASRAEQIYSDGMSLFGYEGANPINRTDSSGLDWHHFYPMYLGGSSSGPGIWLSGTDHSTFHNELSRLLGGRSPEKQRLVWRELSDEARKAYLTRAAEAAGLDVDDPQFKIVLEESYSKAKHGALIDRGPITKGMHYKLRRSGRGPRGFVHAHIKGANRARSIGAGTAIASGALAAAPLLVFFDSTDENLLELAKTTIRSKGQGGLTLWDEAFALVDFYALTQNPVAAGAGWLFWSASLSGQDPWAWYGGQN